MYGQLVNARPLPLLLVDTALLNHAWPLVTCICQSTYLMTVQVSDRLHILHSQSDPARQARVMQSFCGMPCPALVKQLYALQVAVA